MNANLRSFSSFILIATFLFSSAAQALELQYLIDGKDNASFFSAASGIKMGNDGVVYVASQKKGSLIKIVEGKVEVVGLLPKIFSDNELGGVDLLDNGDIVVTNRDSGKVAIFDQNFTLKTRFSKSGEDPGELEVPKAVTVSTNNHIYVSDSGNRRISVFNSQGLFLFSFDRRGSDGKDLKKPSHISLDADENIYLLEGPTRFSVFDRDGKLIDRISNVDLKDEFDETPEFTALAADLNGNVYIGDYVSSQISIVDWRQRKVLKKFGSLGQSRAQFRHISYLSVNSKGQIAVLDNKNKKVEVYLLDQKTFKKPTLTDQLQLAGRQESPCRAIHTFTEKHNLCIKRGGKGIILLTQDGKENGAFAAEVKKPRTLHSDSNQVAILEGNKLHVYDRNGKNRFSIGRYGSATGGFQDPSQVFVHNNQYYVSDTGNNRVQIFAADGQFLEQIRETHEGETLFNTVGPIAVDSQGQLYIADRSKAGMIRIIDKNRKLVGSIGHKGKSIHKTTQFHAIDVDKQDRLYVLSSTDYNRYGIAIYRDGKLYKRFGAGSSNGSDMHFAKIKSMSVESAATNSVHVNDTDLKRHYRFDLLEIPDAVFGLNIAANNNEMKLSWSSSQSPLITAYEIQGAAEETGPYTLMATTTDIKQTMSMESVGDNLWFRIISVSGHGLRASPSAAKENKFQTMSALFKAGKFEAVVKLANKLLKISPDNSDARDILAMSLYQLGDYTRAISVYKQLEADENYRNQAIKYQVQAYYQLGQFLDARALIDEVLEAEPAEVEPYLVCTQLSLELDDAIGAVTCAEDGLAKHESHIELRYLLGRAYIEAGIEDEGLIAYQTIVDNHPQDHAIRLKIADDLYAMQSYSDALGHYETVLAGKPDSGDAAVGMARSLLQLDRDDEAKAIAIKLSGKKATKGDGNYLLGKIAAKQGEHKKAVLRLTRASKEKPEFVDAWVSLGEAYVQLNQLPKAVKSLKQGIKSNSESYELYELAGQIQLDQENYPEANAHLDRAVILQPQSLKAQKLYTRGLFASRNYRSAALHADAAARIAPKDIDVLTLQADIANQHAENCDFSDIIRRPCEGSVGPTVL